MCRWDLPNSSEDHPAAKLNNHTIPTKSKHRQIDSWILSSVRCVNMWLLQSCSSWAALHILAVLRVQWWEGWSADNVRRPCTAVSTCCHISLWKNIAIWHIIIHKIGPFCTWLRLQDKRSNEYRSIFLKTVNLSLSTTGGFWSETYILNPDQKASYCNPNTLNQISNHMKDSSVQVNILRFLACRTQV